ncbi:hypothetical protein ZIOFF_053007 [Zingiber officinale]|uniref:Annexin n=1 Tax=Zingiber officinale TaxID=94328 RepID=A0A8J5KMP7_ZINOF|nr:hypothetical protein ZIOFF_053007 [Zingiber officinale]
MFEPLEREAVFANIALKRKLDYRVIIEIACVNSPKELLAVKDAYQGRYKHCLEEDVAAHTVGDLRQLLVVLVSTYRYDGEEIDVGVARSEAKTIQVAIDDHSFNHSEIIRILSTRSRAQLRATFNHYKDEFGVSITKAMAFNANPPNEFAHALRTAIRCIISPLKTNVTLEHAIGKEVSGDYKAFLLALIGN